MSGFFNPARSIQRLFFYKRPQAQTSICSLQRRFLETSGPAACAERPAPTMSRDKREKIINHPSAVQDISKIPRGYAFIPANSLAIAKICRKMAREQKKATFACVSTQTPVYPRDSHGRQLPMSKEVKRMPIFGLYVPSDIADAATIEFKEQTRAYQHKRHLYINRFYPHMPSVHRYRFNSEEYKSLQGVKRSIERSLKRVKFTLDMRLKTYIRNSILKEEGKLNDEEVKLVMTSWKDGSEMPDIGLLNTD